VTLQQLEQQTPGGFVRSLAGDQALIQPVHEGLGPQQADRQALLAGAASRSASIAAISSSQPISLAHST
jgi:hypothetical protein